MRIHLGSGLWIFIITQFGLSLVLISLYYSPNSKSKKLEPFQEAYAVNNDEDITTLTKLFEKTNSILEFFEKNFEQLNADGLFGIRIAQGLIFQLCNHCKVLKTNSLNILITVLNTAKLVTNPRIRVVKTDC